MESNLLVSTNIVLSIGDFSSQCPVRSLADLNLDIQYDDDNETYIYGSKFVTVFPLSESVSREQDMELSQGLILAYMQGEKQRNLYAYIASHENDNGKPELFAVNVTASYDAINPQKKQGRPYVYRGTVLHLTDNHRQLRRPRAKSQLSWLYGQLSNGAISAQSLYEAGVNGKVIKEALLGRYAYLMVDSVMLDRGETESKPPVSQQTQTQNYDDYDYQRMKEQRDALRELLTEKDMELRKDKRELQKYKEREKARLEKEELERKEKEERERREQEELKRLESMFVTVGNYILPLEYKKLKSLATIRENIMLTGSSGSGKTFVCSVLAQDLDLKFGSVSCSEGMTESQLSGLLVPYNGGMEFLNSEFVERYENGGIFLFDEMDSADSNTLNFINTALANDSFYLPLRKGKTKVTKHEDFICIAATNTLGDGANRLYTGRTQLDAATLDRFRAGIIKWEYNEAVERKLVDVEIFRWGKTLRAFIDENNLPYVMSTRVMLRFTEQKRQLGFGLAQWEESYFSNWNEDDIEGYRTFLKRKP